MLSCCMYFKYGHEVSINIHACSCQIITCKIFPHILVFSKILH